MWQTVAPLVSECLKSCKMAISIDFTFEVLESGKQAIVLGVVKTTEGNLRLW